MMMMTPDVFRLLPERADATPDSRVQPRSSVAGWCPHISHLTCGDGIFIIPTRPPLSARPGPHHHHHDQSGAFNCPPRRLFFGE